MRFGDVEVWLVFKGTPRLRVRGARIMRWESVRVPLPIVSGVKSAEDGPRGASSGEAIPLPGRAASAAGMGRWMEPILEEWLGSV